MFWDLWDVGLTLVFLMFLLKADFPVSYFIRVISLSSHADGNRFVHQDLRQRYQEFNEWPFNAKRWAQYSAQRLHLVFE